MHDGALDKEATAGPSGVAVSLEAAGDFLADSSRRRRLYHALGLSAPPVKPVYFEALIRTEAVGNAPSSITIVATRLIH